MGKAPCYAILQDYSRDMGKSSYDQGRRNRDTKLKHHIIVHGLRTPGEEIPFTAEKSIPTPKFLGTPEAYFWSFWFMPSLADFWKNAQMAHFNLCMEFEFLGGQKTSFEMFKNSA